MQYNQRNPAVRRLLKEAKELKEEEENGDYRAEPMEDNLFEWHFTIRGPPDTPFHNGQYHGRILLPVDYPMKPPSIIFLTPNGRFKVGEKICLSITGYHPEYWQPAWGIRTVCVALLSFFPTQGNGAIGSLDYTDEERRLYARKSLSWTCPNCVSKEKMSLPDVAPASSSTTKPRPDGESLPEFSFVYEKDKVTTPAEGGGGGENSTEAVKDPSGFDSSNPTPGVVDGSGDKEETEGEGKEEEEEETIMVDKGKKRETLNESGLSGLRYRYPGSGSGTTTAETGGGAARVKGEAQTQSPKPQPQTQAQVQAQPPAQRQPQAQAQQQQQQQQQQQPPPPQESLVRGVLDLLIFLLTSLLAYILYLKYQTPGSPSS